MRSMDQPIVGAINGVAAGAGASLAFACDLRIAAEEARFLLAFGRIGLVPDSGATWFLPRLVGAAKAAETGPDRRRRSRPQTRSGSGWWRGSCRRPSLATEARAIAARLAALAPRALALDKARAGPSLGDRSRTGARGARPTFRASRAPAPTTPRAWPRSSRSGRRGSPGSDRAPACRRAAGAVGSDAWRPNDDRSARSRPDPRSPSSGRRPPSNAGACPTTSGIALFEAHVTAGGKVEATDWMPDEYRTAVLRFVEMHANSELMGVLPEREWLMRAPTLRRKLALTAKVQDEVGHAQLLYRVAEDLGKPREAMFDDLLAGKTKFHNVFHYPTVGWADVGMIAWLVDAAAIVAQMALRDCALRAVRADDAQDLLGGIGPHHARPRRRGDDGDRHADAARRDPGRARPLVGPADADARPALAARAGPRPPLADQGQDVRGAAPGVPDHLRAADPRARAGHPGPGRCASTRPPASGATPSPTGTSCGRS